MIFLYVIITFCALPTPQRLVKPGIVVLGSRKCNYTQKIIDWLTAQGKPFTIEYIDNDKELNNYIVDEHKGGIPIVFENGVYQGTGKEYINKPNGGVSQPVAPQTTAPQPIAPQTTEPKLAAPQTTAPQPIAPQQPAEPTAPQPAEPKPIAPQTTEPKPAEPPTPNATAPQQPAQPPTPNPIAPPPSPQQPIAPQPIVPCVINPVSC